MSLINKLSYHEIDFLVPAQRFNIQFSYVTKQGLSFIREYVLRLVQLAPMAPSQISIYLGLSKAETDEAISDLMDKGNLRYNAQGKIDLTPQAEAFFEGLGKPPKTSTIQDTNALLSFELSGFNCTGSKRHHDKWKSGVELIIDNQKLSQTELIARNHFQKNFYLYYDKGFLKGIKKEENERPGIYTIGSVSRLSKDALRLPCAFYIDMEGRAIEREDFDALDDSSETHELITRTLGQKTRTSNIHAIAEAMDALGDTWTRKIISNNSVNTDLFLRSTTEALAADVLDTGKGPLLLVGPVYLKKNWDQVFEQLKKILGNKDSNATTNGKVLNWIAPSDRFWGKSSHINEYITELTTRHFIKNKKNRNNFQSRLFLPVQGASDRRVINKWLYDLRDSADINYGLIEGFLGGDVEILYIENEIVVVCYHIVFPDGLPVPLPLGFISTEKQVVKRVFELASAYIQGVSPTQDSNNLGLLKDL